MDRPRAPGILGRAAVAAEQRAREILAQEAVQEVEVSPASSHQPVRPPQYPRRGVVGPALDHPPGVAVPTAMPRIKRLLPQRRRYQLPLPERLRRLRQFRRPRRPLPVELVEEGVAELAGQEAVGGMERGGLVRGMRAATISNFTLHDYEYAGCEPRTLVDPPNQRASRSYSLARVNQAYLS
jgi:hypothetical protein